MYHRLRSALPWAQVFPQVSFSALLQSQSQATRNTFNRKVADYVICDPSLSPLAVIELDDSSHRGREAADAHRDSLLTKAGYRVIRYPNVPDADRIQADFPKPV
jgi:very-short-patch-repair endonuclease